MVTNLPLRLGSGKTTLLSMITGDHPQSYTQNYLEILSSPRKRLPTAVIQRIIGVVSPELNNAFPRRLGENAMTVRDAIGSGFENIFTYRPRSHEQDERIDQLLNELGPASWGGEGKDFDQKPFALLSSGEQSLVLLLRALVGKPRILILDEVFAGMDARMISSAKRYLRHRLQSDQAVVFVTHWEEEFPWPEQAKVISLEKGFARIT